MESKKPWLSKTVWFGVLTAVAPFIAELSPAAEAWISGNTATIGMIWGALAVVLRLVTKDKVVLKD